MLNYADLLILSNYANKNIDCHVSMVCDFFKYLSRIRQPYIIKLVLVTE